MNSLAIDKTKSRSHALEYIELMKPELTGLSVLTTLCGFYLASSKGEFNGLTFVHTALGTLLVGGGAGALNQFIERKFDALMKRTERRPLPSGRLVPRQALMFGIVCSIIGMLELLYFVNPLTGLLGGLTWASYLFLYTPLKRITPLSTIVGGIPGAIPPMMGWTAVRNSLSIESWILFAILFCWQMPHFFSLAWMYKKDYARAGFKVLSVLDESGARTSKQILLYTALLIPASIAPAYFGLTGTVSFIGAILLGLGFMSIGILQVRFSMQTSSTDIAHVNFYARKMFFASLLYLPALMLLLSFDKL